MKRTSKTFLLALGAVFLLGVFTANAKVAPGSCGSECSRIYNNCMNQGGWPPNCINEYVECLRGCAAPADDIS